MKSLHSFFLMFFCCFVINAKSQQVITVHISNGMRYQFPIEDIYRIHHEYQNHKTYKLGEMEYPMPHTIKLVEDGPRWANINVGAVHEFDPGLWFDKSQIEEVLETIGDNWRLPTMKDIEELLHIRFYPENNTWYCEAEGKHPYIFGASKGNVIQICGGHQHPNDNSDVRIPLVSEDHVMIEQFPLCSENNDIDNWGFTFFSRLTESSNDVYKFCFFNNGKNSSSWYATYKAIGTDDVSHIRLITNSYENGKETIVIELKDGQVYEFSPWSIMELKQEMLDDNSDSYTINGVKYPALKEVSGFSVKGLKWANMDVGVMNEDELSPEIPTSQIDEVLEAVGNGWRLPTKEEIEELLGITFTWEDGEYICMENTKEQYVNSVISGPPYIEYASSDIKVCFQSPFNDEKLYFVCHSSDDTTSYLSFLSQLSSSDKELYCLSSLNHWYTRYIPINKDSQTKIRIRLVKD